MVLWLVVTTIRALEVQFEGKFSVCYALSCHVFFFGIRSYTLTYENVLHCSLESSSNVLKAASWLNEFPIPQTQLIIEVIYKVDLCFCCVTYNTHPV